MVGQKYGKDVLNNTLLFVAKLLNDNNIPDWFIGYGTLLGIVRENSCIDNDDDIDIIIDISNYQKVKQLLIDNNLEMEYGFGIGNNKNILKTKPSPQQNYCSIDFYMATVNKVNGNFNDTWEKVIWRGCYTEDKQLIERIWNDQKIYLPNNFIEKIVNRYGDTWETPRNVKFPVPKKPYL